MADYNYLSDGRPDGTVLGNDADDKVGFYGTAPSAQRADASMAAVTGTTVSATAGRGFKTSAAFNSFVAQVEEIRATLVALGLHKGSA